MKYQLITTEPLARVVGNHPDTSKGFPSILNLPEGRTPPTVGDGYKYVKSVKQTVFDRDLYSIDRFLSEDVDGWQLIAFTAEEIAERARVVVDPILAWQAKAALELTPDPDGTNLLDAAEAALDGLPDGTAKIVALSKWNNNSSFDIQSPIIQQLAGAIGIDEAELKQLFQLGASL